MLAGHVETLHSNGALVAFLPRNLFENSKGIWKSGSNPFIRSISHLQSPPQKMCQILHIPTNYLRKYNGLDIIFQIIGMEWCINKGNIVQKFRRTSGIMTNKGFALVDYTANSIIIWMRANLMIIWFKLRCIVV